MTRWSWAMPGALALLVSACATTVTGPVDLSAVLVGTWQGDVQMAAGTYPRTLTIKSIREVDGRTVVEAEYGGTGGGESGIRPVLVKIEAFGKDVTLRFTTVEAWPVELSLYPDRRHLLGDLNIPVSLGGEWAVNPVRLTKSE
jgi:hypothetical protein